MNLVKKVLSGVGVVVHQHLDSLAVHVVGASGVISLANVGVLVSETLSEEVFFSVSGLMGDHLVANHNVAVASLLAGLHVGSLLLLLGALVEAKVVVSSNDVLDVLLKREELLLVEGLFGHTYL
jgi:hypothetical protein